MIHSEVHPNKLTQDYFVFTRVGAGGYDLSRKREPVCVELYTHLLSKNTHISPEAQTNISITAANATVVKRHCNLRKHIQLDKTRANSENNFNIQFVNTNAENTHNTASSTDGYGRFMVTLKKITQVTPVKIIFFFFFLAKLNNTFTIFKINTNTFRKSPSLSGVP